MQADVVRFSKRRAGQRGQAILMVSMGITFLLGILGLVVDVGYDYYVKQAAQAAADSAVMAAVTDANAKGATCGTSVLCQTGYACPSDPQNTTDFGVACLYAKANGFVNRGKQTVTVSSGTGAPPSNAGVNTTYWVSVTATQNQPLGFLGALGVGSPVIAASATGAVIKSGGGGGCIYVLDPSLSGAMTVVGTTNLTSNCGIYVNSTASDALTAKGNSVTTASVVDVVGKASINNNATVSPLPTTGVSAAVDPLANLPAPNFSGCDHTYFSSTGGTVNFTPGVFCGGIKISGQAVLNFSPGIYILNGGGFTSTSNNTIINGAGVFFYNTSSGYTFGPIQLAGGTQVTLTGPSGPSAGSPTGTVAADTSGTYKGILFFQDRTIKSSATNTIAGGANPTMTGSVYMPTANVNFVGNSATGVTLAFIVDTLTVTGTAQINQDVTGQLTGFAASKAYLVQ